MPKGVVPLRVGAALNGVSLEVATRWIECGRWPWTWDFRCSGHRGYPMVLVGEVWEECRGRDVARFADLSWDAVLALVLPHSKPLVRSAELKHAFAVSYHHISNLVREGCLQGPSHARGRTAARWLRRDSVVAFLRQRLLAGSFPA